MLGSSHHRGLHLGIKALGLKTLTHQAHPQSGDRLLEGGGVVRYGGLQAGGIAGILTGHDLQQLGSIGHRVGEGTHLIEGTGKGNQAPAADPPVGGLQAHHTTEGRRLTDRAARVGAQRGHALAGSHSGRTAARAAPRHLLQVPGITTGTKGRCLGGAAHGELIEIGFAEHHGPGLPEPVRHRRLIGGHKILQHPAGAGGANPLGAEVVFDR